MLVLFIYLLVGAIAGVIAGIFGIGGGIVIVPSLIFTFSYLDFSTNVITHLAIGTSLSTIIFTSLSAIYSHSKKVSIDWSLALNLSLGMIVGALLSAVFADNIPALLLQRGFAVFAVLIALQMWFSWSPKASLSLPSALYCKLIGTIIGLISGLFGIAGGSLVVPVLTLFSIKLHQAIATAAVTGFPIAIAGALGYILMGWSNSQLPEYSFGYVYLPATLGIILTSTIFAKLGVKISHNLSPTKIKKSFSILLLVVAVKLFF
ncbi:MAG: sulfite exporter TauE/SafE family protein [Psychromonas sp.]